MKTQNLLNIFNVFFFTLGLMLFSLSSIAQQNHIKPRKHSDQRKEKIESARIGFITQRLNLKPEQAEKFWPVYNEYQNQKKEIRKNMHKIKKMNSNLTITDEQIIKNINKMIDLKQQKLDIEKECIFKLQKVLTARQLVELHKAENDFTMMLLNKLGENK